MKKLSLLVFALVCISFTSSAQFRKNEIIINRGFSYSTSNKAAHLHLENTWAAGSASIKFKASNKVNFLSMSGGGAFHFGPDNGPTNAYHKWYSNSYTTNGRISIGQPIDINANSKITSKNNWVTGLSNAQLVVSDSEKPTQAFFVSKGNFNGETAGITMMTGSGWGSHLRTNQNNAHLELLNRAGTWYHRWKDGNYIAKGAIGIGITNFNEIPKGYKLAVNGKAIATEVVVKLKNSWPDYVFAENYELKDLKAVEQYITEHKHLPNIPSAEEVKENGIAVGEMQTKMMEKIEELTLYIIELQKRIETLEKQ